MAKKTYCFAQSYVFLMIGRSLTILISSHFPTPQNFGRFFLFCNIPPTLIITRDNCNLFFNNVISNYYQIIYIIYFQYVQF